MSKEMKGEGEAREARAGVRARDVNDLVGSDNAQQGRGHKKGHKSRKHGSQPDMEGGAFADGSDMGVTGVGLRDLSGYVARAEYT